MLFYLQPCLGSLLKFGFVENTQGTAMALTLLPHRVEVK